MTTWDAPTRFRTALRENRRCWNSFRGRRGEFLTSARETGGCSPWSRGEHSDTDAVAVDFSPAMLEASRKRFADDSRVRVIKHNMDSSLPALGKFDAVISSFAIHHLVHERKRALYEEVFALLNPDGVFCNLEHVSSPTPQLHEEFLLRIGFTVETEDPSNKLLGLETQLGWLREIGFTDVDCLWKWRELALLVGRK